MTPMGDAKAKDTNVFICPCSQEKEFVTLNQKGEKVKKRVVYDVYIVISEEVFLLLEPETQMKGIGKLISWGTLATIDSIKRSFDNSDYITLVWR